MEKIVMHIKYLLKNILFIFREGGRREKGRERNMDCLPLVGALTGDGELTW